MRRSLILVSLIGFGTLAALWLLLQTPASLRGVLSHPLQTLWGTQQQLNATLLEVSESGEPVRAAGRRLLQPLGMVRLIKLYDASDSNASKKR